jgi:hypothetical protein
MAIGPSETLLDRCAQAFQFRIQQRVSLHDQEIERLATYLTGLKSQILESNHRLQDLDGELRSAAERKRGLDKQREAAASAARSRLKSAHHEVLQELLGTQSAELDQAQQLFEAELDASLSHFSEKLASAWAVVAAQIERLRSQIEGYRTAASTVQPRERPAEEPEDDGAIRELQATIRMKNAERFQNLRESKDRLSAVLETLDGMVKSHALAVADRRRALRDLDQDYESALAKVEERQAPRLLSLRQRLDDVRQRAATLARGAHHLGHTNQKQLQSTLKDLDTMKRKSSTDQGTLEKEEDRIRIEGLEKELAGLKKRLALKEQKLVEARQKNQELKGDIWRMRHELKFRGSISLGVQGED